MFKTVWCKGYFNMIIESIQKLIEESTKFNNDKLLTVISKKLIKHDIIKGNIKRFNLKNNYLELKKSLKIDEIREFNKGTFEVVVFPIDEKSTDGYLGIHTVFVEIDLNYKIYYISVDG